MPYVSHPRYGDRPRITGLDVDPESPDVHLHWNTRRLSTEARVQFRKLTGRDPEPPRDGSRAIPGTALAADASKQTPATVPVTHYYDIERRCRDCDQWFLFFAAEQKIWYEELGFPLEADCVRCVPCRRDVRALKERQRRYEELFHRADRSPEEELEITLCRLELMEHAIFGPRPADAVRSFLRRNPQHPRAAEIEARLEALAEGS